MKKIMLSVMLVLALSLSAAAATTWTTNGYVQFKTNDLLADTIAWENHYRLNFAGTVSENAGFLIRFEDGSIDVDEAADAADGTGVSKVNVATVLKRANYWVKTPVGKVVVGQQFEDLSGISYNYAGDFMATSFTGVGFYPTIAQGVTAFGFYNPSAKQFGAQAKGTVAGITAWGGVSKKDAEDDMKLSIGGSYAIGEVATVYGQFDKQGDVDEKYVGATGSAAGFDWTAEYALDSKTIGLDLTKVFGGVEFNAGYEKVDQADGTLYFGTKLYF